MVAQQLVVEFVVIGGDDNAVIGGQVLRVQINGFEIEGVIAFTGENGNMRIAVFDLCAFGLQQIHDFNGRMIEIGRASCRERV